MPEVFEGGWFRGLAGDELLLAAGQLDSGGVYIVRLRRRKQRGLQTDVVVIVRN